MPTKEVDLQAESVLQGDKATAHGQSYVYRPLRFNEIRLLELLPRTRRVDQNCRAHCSAAAHIGDSICVIYGSMAPVVLQGLVDLKY
jgi:hypothetical protein